MKKLLALLLALVMVFALAACGQQAATTTPEASTPVEEANPLPDWTEYNALIAEIKSTTDFADRVTLMHEAEDILMDSGAILPIYYYNDLFMMTSSMEGFYANAFGTKFFMYCTNGDSTTLRINLASEPDYLDPALNSSVDGACLAANSFGGLYTYDADSQLVPNFAEGYEMSEDGLTYTFTLKEGLKWSDGSDLTADDFVYSWKRAADPMTAADYNYMLNCIAGYDAAVDAGDMSLLEVSAPDATTLVVNLTSPCAYFLDLVAFPTYYAVKQSEVESAADWETNPGAWCQNAGFVSSGAYVLESWEHDTSMVYVKNPYWWDADNVTIERIEFMLSDDDTAILAAYTAGDLDFIDTVPTDEIANLKDNPEFYIIDNLGTYYVCFNVKSPLFEGKTAEQASAMRKAFGLLVDRQYIIDTVGQCEQEIATSFIPAGMADGNNGFFKDAAAWSYPVDDGYYDTAVDVEGAIALLEEAGFKFENGMLSAETPISFEYLTNDTSGHVAIAECIQQDLAAVGITMTIRPIDWATFLQERKAGNYDIARNGWLADFNDPINMLEMWETDSGNNDCQFGR